MTQPTPEDTPPPTPSPEPPSADTAPADPDGTPIKWSEIIQDWIDYGNKVVKRVSDRAKDNAEALENKKYGRGEFFDDLAWFWDRAAEDAAAAAQYVRDKSPGNGK